MDWTNRGKVAFIVLEYNGKFYHFPWFPLDYFNRHPNWIEQMIQKKLSAGYTVLIKDFGYHYFIPESYNIIHSPVVGEQLSLLL